MKWPWSKKDLSYKVNQEPLNNIIQRSINNMELVKNLFYSNIWQLMPIWIMLLIQAVTEYRFKTEEYISNLLIFIVISCATILSDFFDEKRPIEKEMPVMIAAFILIAILSLASVLYCLFLLQEFNNIFIRKYLIFCLILIWILIVVVINLWQVARKDK